MKQKQTVAQRAAVLRAELTANVDALYAETITSDEFHARQIATWNRIQVSRKLDDAVCALMRGDRSHPSLRSAS